jgi:hypothetical protein
MVVMVVVVVVVVAGVAGLGRRRDVPDKSTLHR